MGDGCLPTKEDLTGAIAIARRGGGCQFLEKACGPKKPVPRKF